MSSASSRATERLCLTPFLDITTRVDSGASEMGLLGLAFHPNYASNGYFYVYYTRDPGPGLDRSRVSRFKVTSNPDIADPNSEQVLLEFEQPYSNHNGGDLHFDPFGYLNIASGDGGSGGDPQNRGQSTTTLLGKMLRINVDPPPPGCGLQPARVRTAIFLVARTTVFHPAMHSMTVWAALAVTRYLPLASATPGALRLIARPVLYGSPMSGRTCTKRLTIYHQAAAVALTSDGAVSRALNHIIPVTVIGFTYPRCTPIPIRHRAVQLLAGGSIAVWYHHTCRDNTSSLISASRVSAPLAVHPAICPIASSCPAASCRLCRRSGRTIGRTLRRRAKFWQHLSAGRCPPAGMLTTSLTCKAESTN